MTVHPKEQKEEEEEEEADMILCGQLASQLPYYFSHKLFEEEEEAR